MRHVLAVLLAVTSLSACTAGSGRTQVPAARHSAAASPSTFCVTARTIGMQDVVMADSSVVRDPKSLLAGLDRLSAAAPTEIAASFARFDKLEHVLLQGGHPDPSVARYASGTQVRQDLRRIADYLAAHCGIATGRSS